MCIIRNHVFFLQQQKMALTFTFNTNLLTCTFKKSMKSWAKLSSVLLVPLHPHCVLVKWSKTYLVWYILYLGKKKKKSGIEMSNAVYDIRSSWEALHLSCRFRSLVYLAKTLQVNGTKPKKLKIPSLKHSPTDHHVFRQIWADMDTELKSCYLRIDKEDDIVVL